jgi:hypothetical protein
MAAIENCCTAALGGHVERCGDCGYQRVAYNSCLMGKFSNGESACSSLRADLGWPPFCSPLLHVVGRPAIFSVGRNEPSGRCCGTRVSGYPDRIGAHSISVFARSVCWSEQQRLEVIGRRPPELLDAPYFHVRRQPTVWHRPSPACRRACGIWLMAFGKSARRAASRQGSRP